MKLTGILALGLSLLVGLAQASEAEALLKASGKGGGICVVVGAKDLALAKGIAEKSSFFVQVVQPDVKKAESWRAEIGAGKLREKLWVRDGKFDPGHYASALLNLVVTESVPGGKLKELTRILAPEGVLAVRSPGGALSAAGFKKLSGPAGWALLRKAAGPVGKFAPSDSVRWHGGSRWQRIMYHDFPSVAFGKGKLIYRETVASVKGGYRFEMICRDAFNGRVLWRIEEAPFTGKDWGGYLRSRMGLAITPGGKVYTGLGREFVCLDAETGKVLSELGGRPGGGLRLSKGRYLLAGGNIIDTQTGKSTGTYQGGRSAVKDGVIYVADGRGRNISAYQIPDGKLLWRKNVQKEQPGGQFNSLFCSRTALHIRRSWPAATLSTMDLKTGKTLWTYPPPPRPKVRDVLAYAFDDKLYIAYNDKSVKEKRDFTFKAVDAASGKVLKDKLYAKGKKWAGGCWGPRRAGDYVLYHHNLWFNVKTMKRTYLVLFRPKCGQGPLPVNGMIYGFPGRKAGAIKGLAALVPRDIEFDGKPGGKVLRKLGPAVGGAAAGVSDWPTYRGGTMRGNSVKTSLGGKLVKKWETAVGLGGNTYGRMDAERTGLAQATVAWGLVFVADIDGGRVAALNASDGKVKWSYHVGSRVAFSPTLYKGLCLFGAKDGWVYCLNAATGKPIYKLLIAPRERYIGGNEKLESMWPVVGDVLVSGGVAYASAGMAASIHGGIRVVAFDPRSGKVLWSKCRQGVPSKNDGEVVPALFVSKGAGGPVRMGRTAFDPKTGAAARAGRSKGLLGGVCMEDWLATNNLSRLSEDMGGAGISNGRVRGRLIAFDDKFGMGFSVGRAPKKVFHTGTITLAGQSTDGKTKWAHATERLNIDDLLITSDRAYCVGHYESGGKPPELREISLSDGKVLARHEIKAFPTYNGMSAAGKQLFIATREGKLVCFEGK